jgi:5-methylthioadenosine/S-adenosylhomocysteine deaminase
MDVLEVQPRRVLELATIDGARNLGIADRVGSLTPGKRADLILVRTTDLNTAPLSNPVNLIVQSAQPANIDTVIIDGRILKRNRELVAIDAAQVVREAAESLAAVRARAGGP